MGSLTELSPPFCFSSVGDLHHGKADHLVSQPEAGLEHLGHGIFSKILIFNVHYRVVKGGGKGLSQGLDLGLKKSARKKCSVSSSKDAKLYLTSS